MTFTPYRFCKTRSPKPGAAGAHAQDLDRPAIHSPRGLHSRTSEILKRPRLTVEVQDRAGAGGAAVRLDPVQREHLSSGVRLDPQRQSQKL